MRKKIMITGASGLLGSHLVEMLLEQDQFEIYVLTSGPEKTWVNRNVNPIQINLAEEWDVNKLPGNLHAIFHLSQAEKFRDFPNAAKEVFYINTVSTMRLIDHAVKTGVSHFIYASSGAVYGTDGTFNEQETIIVGKDREFYAGTKLCSELLLQNYQKLLNVITLRFFFIYGKGQKRDMLLPRLVGFVKNNQEIGLEGEEGMKINPVNATDAAKAAMATLNLTGSYTINVAGPQILSLKNIGDIIGNELGILPKFKIDAAKRTKVLIADITEMKKLLINPSVEFKDGVKTLI